MQFYSRAVHLDVVAPWLRRVGRSIIDYVLRKARTPRVLGPGQIIVKRSAFYTQHGLNLKITAKSKHAHKTAFDYSFRVPPGGLKPPPGQGVWKMEKPEGFVFRSRIYTKPQYQGKVIRRKGWLQEAVEYNLHSMVTGKKGPRGRRHYNILASNLGHGYAVHIKDKLTTHFRRLGYGVQSWIVSFRYVKAR
jgi:hypothetical protein